MKPVSTPQPVMGITHEYQINRRRHGRHVSERSKTYNRDRFMAQYQQMKRQGIRCRGQRQRYYQLISFFPEIAHEIAFVAENGIWVVSEDICNGELTKADFRRLSNTCSHAPMWRLSPVWKNSAYTLKRYNDALKAVAAMYCIIVWSLWIILIISTMSFKFGLNITDERIPEGLTALHDAIGDIMVPVHTGWRVLI